MERSLGCEVSDMKAFITILHAPNPPTRTNFKELFDNEVIDTQFGNFTIFPSLRFYVKPILKALNFDLYTFFHFFKAEIERTKFTAPEKAKPHFWHF